MPTRERLPTPIVILVVISLVAGAVVAATFNYAGMNDRVRIIAVGLLMSQLGLLGVWVGLSPLRQKYLASLCATAGVGWWYMLTVGIGPRVMEWSVITMFGAVVLVAASGIILAKGMGWILYTVDAEGTPIVDPTSATPAQFSLAQVFVWTTVMAVAALVVRFILLITESRWQPEVIWLAMPFPVLTWLAVWAMLGRDLLFRIPLLPIVAVGSAFALTPLVQMPQPLEQDLHWMCLAHMFFTAGSLAVFRRRGFRFSKPPREAAANNWLEAAAERELRPPHN